MEQKNYLAEDMRKSLLHKRIIELDASLEHAANEIGISKATLSRLEHGKMPDIETFAKCCIWLDKSPNTFFKTRSCH